MRQGGAVLCAMLWAHMCTGLPTLERGGEAAVAAGCLGPPVHRAGVHEVGGVAQSGKLLQSMARSCCLGIRGGGEGKDKDKNDGRGGGDSEGGKASRMCAGSSKQLRAARQGLQGVGGRICQRPVLIKETNSTRSSGSAGGGRPSLGKLAAQRGDDANSDPCTGSSTSSGKRGDGSAAGDSNLPKPKMIPPPKTPPSPPSHVRQNSNASTVGLRYWYDRKLKQWVIVRREGEDLSPESLQGYWSFPQADCLTWRFRKPDRWGSVPWGPSIFGYIEFLIYITPGLNWVMKTIKGLWPCAVCNLPRQRHPFKCLSEADAAFWEAYQERDIPLCIRLVRGGVDCYPGGTTWCLLAFVCANYCKDPYKGVKSPRPDSKLDTDHLTQKTQEFVTPFTTTMPFL